MYLIFKWAYRIIQNKTSTLQQEQKHTDTQTQNPTLLEIPGSILGNEVVNNSCGRGEGEGEEGRETERHRETETERTCSK